MEASEADFQAAKNKTTERLSLRIQIREVADLMRLCSLAASLNGWFHAPFLWMQLSKPPSLSRSSKHSFESVESARTKSSRFSGSSNIGSIWLS
jgi:hypothetical protein